MTNTNDIKKRLKDACNGHPSAEIPWPHRLLHDAIEHIETMEQSRQAQVPEGVMEIVKAVAHIGIDWGFGVYEIEQHHIDNARKIYEDTSASPAPDHAADVRKMVAKDASELEKAAQKLWRESYNCESDFIQAVVDALSKQEEAER